MKYLNYYIVLTILIIWYIVTKNGLIDPLFVPNPVNVWTEFVISLRNGEVFNNGQATLSRCLLSFALSALVGIPLGLILGRNEILYKYTQPFIDFFRSIPATALFPLFIFAFGIGDFSKIMVAFYASFLSIIINTAYGAKQVKNLRIKSAKLFGASKMQIFWTIIVPETMPSIFAGLRLGISFSFVIIIVTEMFIGTNQGLGYFIINAQMVYQIPKMYVGIIMTGLLGYILNQFIILFEKKALHWVDK